MAGTIYDADWLVQATDENKIKWAFNKKHIVKIENEDNWLKFYFDNGTTYSLKESWGEYLLENGFFNSGLTNVVKELKAEIAELKDGIKEQNLANAVKDLKKEISELKDEIRKYKE